jgi:hypothetical protein
MLELLLNIDHLLVVIHRLLSSYVLLVLPLIYYNYIIGIYCKSLKEFSQTLESHVSI